MMNIRNIAFEHVYYLDRKDEFENIVEKGDKTNMLAAGDSWFSYIGQGYEGLNVIEQFSYLLHYKEKFPHCILNLAINGSHTTHWKEEKTHCGGTLKQYLDKLTNIEFLLFSGGGNDIIDGLPEIPPSDIEKEVSTIIKYEIMPSYTYLLKLCASKNVKIIAHCYTLGEGEGPTTFLGIPLAGPWLSKYNENQKEQVETQTVGQMKDMLLGLQKSYENLLFADTSNLNLGKEDWIDQLHLNQQGCKKVAKVFIVEMLEKQTHAQSDRR